MLMKIKSLLFAVFMLVAALSQAQLTVSVSNIVGPTCNNGCNGSATVSITGGVPPYYTYWISGEGNTNAAALCGGNGRYVIVTDDMGEQVVEYFNVPNPPPTVTVSITPSTTDTVCPGTPITFTANGADTYEWYNGYSTDNPLVYSPPSPTSIFVTGTNTATGCTAMATLTIPVKPRPVMTMTQGPSYSCEGTPNFVYLSGNSDYYTWSDNITRPDSFAVTQSFTAVVTGHSIATGCTSQPQQPVITIFPSPNIDVYTSPACRGEMTYLTAQGGNSYVWSNGSTNQQIGLIADNDTSFSVVGTGWAGCTRTVSVNVHVNDKPNAVVTASNDTVCGDNTPIVISATGGNEYYWYHNSDTNDSLFITPYYSNSYTVRVTDTLTGCSTDATVDITHNPIPYMNATNYNNNYICIGDSAHLVVDDNGNPLLYTWMPDNINTVDYWVTPAVTSTYTLTGTHPITGCVATDSVVIYVIPLPLVVATADIDSVCPGGTVNLSASGADYYIWNSSTPTTINATEIFTVIGYANIAGVTCTNTDSITIVARNLPTIVATASDSSICNGDQITFSVTGATNYQWDSPLNSSNSSLTHAPSSSYDYLVEGTDVHGCTGSEHVFINVVSYPNVTAYPDQNNLCTGQSTVLHANGADSYVWSNGSPDQHQTVTPNNNNIYLVYGTNSGICSDTAYIVMTVIPLPVINVTPSNDTICEYSNLTLTGSGADYYEWIGLNNGFYGQNSFSYQILNDQTFTIRGQSGNGCLSLPFYVYITAQLANTTMQLPVDIICENYAPLVLTAGGVQAGGTFNGNGVNGDIFTPFDAGQGIHHISYYFTSSLGCGIIAHDTITVDQCVGLNSKDLRANWNVYPNPSNGLLNIIAPENMQNDAVIEVYNTTGSLVMSANYKAMQTTTLNLSNLSNGAYLVRVSNGNSTEIYRIVKTD